MGSSLLLLDQRVTVLGSRRRDYTAKLLGTNPIAYYPLRETAGANINDISGNGFDGTYTNVTLADTASPVGKSAPLFGGTGYGNVYSVGLRDALNYTEGSMAMWLKVRNIDFWTEGVVRRALVIYVDGSNYITLYKGITNNQIEGLYRAGGVVKLTAYPTTTLSWFHVTLTWSAINDRLRMYGNGLQSGADVTLLGVWAGVAARVLIGSISTVPADPWNGWLSNPVFYDRELSATEVAHIANP